MDYLGMITTMHRVGKRCNILGFYAKEESEDIAFLKKCNDENEKLNYISKRLNYLVTVIRQMYNPPLFDSDVTDLNRIAHTLQNALDSKK